MAWFSEDVTSVLRPWPLRKGPLSIKYLYTEFRLIKIEVSGKSLKLRLWLRWWEEFQMQIFQAASEAETEDSHALVSKLRLFGSVWSSNSLFFLSCQKNDCGLLFFSFMTCHTNTVKVKKKEKQASVIKIQVRNKKLLACWLFSEDADLIFISFPYVHQAVLLSNWLSEAQAFKLKQILFVAKAEAAKEIFLPAWICANSLATFTNSQKSLIFFQLQCPPCMRN